MSQLYPVFLKLEKKPVLVVGGGPVALRRIEKLLSSEASVTVVSPSVVRGLKDLIDSGKLRWIQRKFESSDLDGAALVFLAAGDPGLVEILKRETQARGIWLSSAEDESASDFHVPATLLRDDVQIAVSTGGASPLGAARLRDAIAQWLDARPELVDSAIATGRAGREASAPGCGTPGRGKVYLVGAGPGDPGLLTLRAAELLASADVVYHDRLVPDSILSRVSPRAERVYVGKEIGCAVRADIDQLLVESARAGKRVVRLKGGDPLVFGRGGEEMAALRRAGIDFEIVPGVSALNSVPAAAGIPLTIKGVSSEIVVRSGHATGSVEPPRSAKTYVYFMAGTRLQEVCRELAKEGVSGRTPVAVIERGTLPGQRTFTCTLDELPRLSETHGIVTPALVVAGEVVKARDPQGLLDLLESARETDGMAKETDGIHFHA